MDTWIWAVAMGLLPVVALGFWLYRIWQYNFRLRYRADWELRLHEGPALDLHGPRLTYYYGDFGKCIHDHTFDPEGVIISWSDLGPGDLQYNPTMVAEWAILQYEKFLTTGDVAHRDGFHKQLQWLVGNARRVGDDKVVWHYHYDTREEKAPWASGIAQGIAISALLRGYCYQGDGRFLVLAKKSFNMLNTAVEDGGFCFRNDTMSLWYEEDNRCGHILNGHIFALLGVYDLFRVTGEVQYRECFERGVAAIRKNIQHFDLGFFTKYRYIDRHPANNSYHRIHVTLFRILHLITGDAWHEQVATRLDNYLHRPWFKMLNFVYVVKIAIREKLVGARVWSAEKGSVSRHNGKAPAGSGGREPVEDPRLPGVSREAGQRK